jgi:hypothetical protein
MGSFTFSVSPGADRQKLQALIEAQFIFEQLNEARLFLVHLLAIVGAPLWFCLWWVTSISQSTRSFLLALWSVCGLITLAVSVLQWVWYRRRTHRLADYEATSQERVG